MLIYGYMGPSFNTPSEIYASIIEMQTPVPPTAANNPRSSVFVDGIFALAICPFYLLKFQLVGVFVPTPFRGTVFPDEVSLGPFLGANTGGSSTVKVKGWTWR